MSKGRVCLSLVCGLAVVAFSSVGAFAGTLAVGSDPGLGVVIAGTHPGTTGYFATVSQGTDVSLTAPDLTYFGGVPYQFSKWTLSEEGDQPNPLEFVMSDDPVVSCYAYYTLAVWTLNVESTGLTGVVIGGSPAGTTNYSAGLNDDTAVSLTAPVSTNPAYGFDCWIVNSVEQAYGVRTLAFDINADTTAVARYVFIAATIFPPVSTQCPQVATSCPPTNPTVCPLVQTACPAVSTVCPEGNVNLLVQSTPITGVAITGLHAGTTNYSASVTACPLVEISLTAPASIPGGGGSYAFVRWSLNGVDQAIGLTAITFAPSANTTAIARYATEYHVTTTGLSGNDGLTEGTAWDIASALTGASHSVQPGDVISIHAGTYVYPVRTAVCRYPVTLGMGTEEAPVVVRGYPGELATIDGGLSVNDPSKYLVIRDLEIITHEYDGTETPNPRGGVAYVQTNATDEARNGIKFVNLVIHNVVRPVEWYRAFTDGEIYGCIIYSSGVPWNDFGGGDDRRWVTAHNVAAYDAVKTKTLNVADNVLVVEHVNAPLNCRSMMMQNYNGTYYQDNITLQGNIAYNTTLPDPPAIPNLTGAPGQYQAGTWLSGDNIHGARNMIFLDNSWMNFNVYIGVEATTYDYNCEVKRNTILNAGYLINMRTVSPPGVIVLDDPDSNIKVLAADPRPAGSKVVLRNNAYDSNRANLAIYNWQRAGSVSVDVSGFIADGMDYALVAPKSFLPGSTYISQGTVSGGAISVPFPGGQPDEFVAYVLLKGPYVTQQPIPTVYPVVQTECPVAETICPVSQTQCPYNETFCPADVPTHCPPAQTVCPEVSTQCPETQTLCPAETTLCPEVATECPPEKATVCPEVLTHCPETQTLCPESETMCPEVATSCPPEKATVCPETQTACPLVTTACPPVETQCPDSFVNLLVQSTPITGVAITGSAAGTTDYTASVTICPAAQVSLTAPAALTQGESRYIFAHWTINSVDQPEGQVSVSFAIAGETTAVALYNITSSAARDVFVATTGTAEGTGAIDDPIDLLTALTTASKVFAGDRVWIRGGTYTSATGWAKNIGSVGAGDAPIIYRAYADERAVLTSASGAVLTITNAPYVQFWGLDINRTTIASNGITVNDGNTGLKLVNNAIHEGQTGGIATGHIAYGTTAIAGGGHEIYGNLLYNCGGQGLLAQNLTTNPELMTIADNVIFKNLNDGIQFDPGSSNTAPLGNMLLEGNILYLCGSSGGCKTIHLRPGSAVQADNITLRENVIYVPENTAGYGPLVRIGRNPQTVANGTVTLTDNLAFGGDYAVSGAPPVQSAGEGGISLNAWGTVVSTGNLLYNGNGPAFSITFALAGFNPAGSTVNNNSYYGTLAGAVLRYSPNIPPLTDDLPTWQGWTGWDAAGTLTTASPTAPIMRLRPNVHEPGKAYLAIYNKDGIEPVSVDLGALWGLANGKGYKITSVENIWGTPAAEGIYSGPVDLYLEGSDAGQVFTAYLVQKTLTLRVEANVAAVAITGAPAGTTNYTTEMANGSAVSLTAPVTAGGRTFTRWTINGVDQPDDQNVITFPIYEDTLASATYTVTGYHLSLNVGDWNLVSLPIDPTDSAPASVFGTNLLGVYAWRTTGGGAYFVPTTIVAKTGYWVAVKADTEKDVTGPLSPTSSVSLALGWNLVGPRANVALPVGVLAVYGWDWPGGLPRYVVPTLCYAGKGYWIAPPAPMSIW